MTTPKGRVRPACSGGTVRKNTRLRSPPSRRTCGCGGVTTRSISGETLMAAGPEVPHHGTCHCRDQPDRSQTPNLNPATKLVIPIAPGRHAAGDSQTYAKRLTVYRVRKSDTVQSVADNLGIAPTVIRRWNRLKGDSLAVVASLHSFAGESRSRQRGTSHGCQVEAQQPFS